MCLPVRLESELTKTRTRINFMKVGRSERSAVTTLRSTGKAAVAGLRTLRLIRKWHAMMLVFPPQTSSQELFK